MNLVFKISDKILLAIFFLFCIPFALPQFELTFILTQFSILLPLYLFINLFRTDLYGIFLITIFFFLIILIPFGLPGSFLGWMAMLCTGYLFGSQSSKKGLDSLLNIKYFFIVSIVLSLWIVLQNYQNIFSYEELSDYFEVSSINTVPLLLVSITNLFCAYYYYFTFINPQKDPNNHKFLKFLFYSLILTSLLLVIVFEFRSGFGIFIILFLVLWSNLGKSLFDLLFKFLLVTALFFLIIYFGVVIYELITILLVPGRTDILLIFEELAVGSLRYEKMINFWSIAGFSKLNIDSWSSYLSVSGMSDFVAGLFPISILFFLPSISLFRLSKYLFTYNSYPALLILFSALSSLMISLLQPDFISMFSFFAISSLIYFGEKRKKEVHL